MESVGQRAERAARITDALSLAYADADCTLDYNSPFELLIGAILSAQCTDERVNRVTPSLFSKYKDSSGFASAKPEELEKDIRAVGMHKIKASHIIRTSRMIDRFYGGETPRDMQELLGLPGVGRKIANLVLGDAFGIPGIVVDTHTGRLARRMGLSDSKSPPIIERDLMEILPKDRWIATGHLFVSHGRAVCKAVKPRCGVCALTSMCPSARAFGEPA